jgi:hypothetical protein
MKIAIIGTAGRDKDKPLTYEDFMWMRDEVENYLFYNTEWDSALKQFEKIHLVSGGAAWADHVAVDLWLDYDFGGITLHLPCEWDATQCQFIDGGFNNWHPGRIANYYHRKFTKTMKELDYTFDSLYDIDDVVRDSKTTDKNINIVVGDGFKDRNSAIACADVVLAFTRGKTRPIPGGTNDTWKKAVANGARCKHFSLGN